MGLRASASLYHISKSRKTYPMISAPASPILAVPGKISWKQQLIEIKNKSKSRNMPQKFSKPFNKSFPSKTVWWTSLMTSTFRQTKTVQESTHPFSIPRLTSIRCTTTCKTGWRVSRYYRRGFTAWFATRTITSFSTFQRASAGT